MFPLVENRRNGQFFVAVAALLLMTLPAACVKRPDKGVSLQNVDADIGFGVKSAEPAAPANTVVPKEVAEEDAFDSLAFRSRFSGPGARAQQACPQAPVSAAAPEEAPLTADELPLAGIYRWKRQGTLQPTGAPFKVPISGFERREIRKVQRINSTDFRFEMLQSDFSSDVVGTTFKVRTAAASARPPGVPDQRAGEPDRGMSIERIERYDAKTGQSKGRAFVPNPPILHLPLPVSAGERFQATGIDVSTEQRRSMTVEGFVPKRELVDACGQLVDGWRVEMTRTQGDLTEKYVLIVATQHGAMPITEFLEYQDARGSVSVTFTIGQLEPDPPGSGS